MASEWISLVDAIALIEATLRLAHPRAEAVLMEACVQDKVSARHNQCACANDWLVSRPIELDPDAIHQSVAEDREHVEINVDHLRRWLGQADRPPLAITSVHAVEPKTKRCSKQELEQFIEDYFRDAQQPTQVGFETAAEARFSHLSGGCGKTLSAVKVRRPECLREVARSFKVPERLFEPLRAAKQQPFVK